ncbi:hypothetical protein [uncultured Microbulbifer sp.]|uniref:hypothetical protein n=1 Tax=uncultured Microbulbifer sp. TaxID=348147 RepID=UPI002605AEEC|nr:hypothetical protein [uncultured Microbulbifer sp.]
MSISMLANYSLETLGAKFCIDNSWPLMVSALDSMPDKKYYNTMDYGAADGGTSLELWRRVFQKLGHKDIYHIANDLPASDLMMLSKNLNRLSSEFESLVVFMQPGSFYKHVAPRASLNLGLAATTMHWLSRMPGKLTEHIQANKVDGIQRKAFRKQSLNDFNRLLDLRAWEFEVGGQFILVDLAQDEAGHLLGNNDKDRDMFDTLFDIWTELYKAGEISKGVFDNAAFQNYYRTDEDVWHVLNMPHHRESWTVQEMSTKITSCPYRSKFDLDGNASEFSEGLMKTIRSWSEQTFRTSIIEHGENLAAINRLFEELQKRILGDPYKYSMDYVHHYIRLIRR